MDGHRSFLLCSLAAGAAYAKPRLSVQTIRPKNVVCGNRRIYIVLSFAVQSSAQYAVLDIFMY